ncbi:19022_t:CDS:2 [Funneliformis geosporum]|uniref:2040_t:CDS:1 n=1 Tax=Funneliformis geosporum TaxID=1117311 RepID=A0A9W4WTX5_9GLOM|nr:2040_t:CDS:2 [Funneliformis geosporum]CAI2191327.1 19022_t:CDS:2 [Funneliformis geosporum]
MTDERPVILWAHARSLSTVFERPFLQLEQEFHVIHEPFVPIGLAYKSNNEELLNRIQPPKTTDPITFKHHFTPSLNEMLTPHYYNDDQTKPLRVFVKDLATIFLSASEGNPLRSKEVLLKFKHTFLIRNPVKSVKSYYKAAISTYKVWDDANVPSSERIVLFSAKDIGLKESRALYDLIKGITEEEIPLVDADDLIRDPEKVMRRYCKMIGAEFKREMLEWKAEKVEHWDVKIPNVYHVPDLYNIWHKNSAKSTGFNKFVNKEEEEIEYPQYVYDIIDDNKPHYEYLHQYKINV